MRPRLCSTAVAATPQPAGPSPVVAVQTSPWLSRRPGGISGCVGAMWSRISFSSSSNSMQTSPSPASPTLQTDAGHRPAWMVARARWPADATSAGECSLSFAFCFFLSNLHLCSFSKLFSELGKGTGPCGTGRRGPSHSCSPATSSRSESYSSLGSLCLVCSRRFTSEGL